MEHSVPEAVAVLSADQRADLEAVLTEIPDRSRGACPASAVFTVPLYLRLTDGRTVAAQWPRTGCGEIAPRFEEIMGTLSVTDVTG